MKAHGEPLVSQALDALAEQCEIPPDLEERILAGVAAAAPPPVAALPVVNEQPFRNVIRITREDDRRLQRAQWGGAALAALLVAFIALGRSSAPARHAASIDVIPSASAGLPGRRLPDDHPRLGEARAVLFIVAEQATKACKAGRWSAVVRFERTGRASVLEVTSSVPEEKGCLEGALALAQLSPRPGPRLSVRLEQGVGAAPRLYGWLTDEG